ncbi:MAG: K+/H+ antiporter subunit F [Burkholderiales bacterium]|nr:MAG: K+/H+ antiporter subunit F [Burkholderiales bacterium]
MFAAVVPFAIGAIAVSMLLAGFRLFRGPAIPDRVLALDTLYINTVALLILVGMHFRTALFFEAALVIAALGFVGTVVLSKFVLRSDIVE